MIAASHRLRLPAAVCAMGLVVAGRAIAADDVSAWDGDARSAVRLIAASAGSVAAPSIRGGVEVRLKPGWHTYWRYPGDAGVPPRFDFGGSQNVRSVEVLWPAPQAIHEQGLTVIGYVGDVIWPITVAALDSQKPVLLRLHLEYAVCDTLCVPAEGKAELTLMPGADGANTVLAAAEGRVPKKTALGEGSTLAVKSVRRVDTPSARVLVDVAAPDGTAVALFAEGPTPEWALPVPSPVAGAPSGVQRFAFDLEGAPPGSTYRGAHITLTAVAGHAAIEVTTSLD